MLEFGCLRSLYCQQVHKTSSSLEQIVHQFFAGQALLSTELIENICVWEHVLPCSEHTANNWKKILTLVLISHFTKSHQQEITSKVYRLERKPWNHNSQYLRAMIAISHVITNMPIPEVNPSLLEGGAALIEIHEYRPWLSLPYMHHHLEYGIFLCILALLTERANLRESVMRLARWQLNSLDYYAKPLSGLFVREQDSSYGNLLALSYLFFRGVSLLSGESLFVSMTHHVLKALKKQMTQSPELIFPLWPLIENLFEQNIVSADKNVKILNSILPKYILDESTALVGYRKAHSTVISTLHGMQTGLGCIRRADIEIITYGPHYLPLDECRGFGIEGNALTEEGCRRSTTQANQHGFYLQGCARMVDEPLNSQFETGKFRGIWLDVVQELKPPRLFLTTCFLGMDGWDAIAISFFVKALTCQIGSKLILTDSLERYCGEAKMITLKGCSREFLELRAPCNIGNVEIIALAGKNHFWGADFLIAYHLIPKQRHYQWQIFPLH